MLSKDKRLNLKKDFKWVAAGKKLESKYLKLFIKVTEDNSVATRARVGIALSSKNFKKAVDRNRARRLVSAAFEGIYSKLPSNINIVALPKSGVIDVKSDDLLLELESILKNKNLLIVEP